jgi:predicted nucleotide-binding protein
MDDLNATGYYNPKDAKGKLNLIRSLSEQILLNNIVRNKFVAEQFANHCEIKNYHVDEEVYIQNEFGRNCLFFVLSGTFGIYFNSHFVRDIRPGECFGEFPILDAKLKYSVSVYSNENSCVAIVGEDELRDIAKKIPEIWYNMAKMLANRLVETNTHAFVKKANKSPKIFIGSSVEGLNVARKIQNALDHEFEPVVWDQGIFDSLGKSYLESLEDALHNHDFAIFVFTADDEITSRGAHSFTVRDNVLFEFGIFLGELGRKRSFMVYPRNVDLKILSDLAGINTATYDPTKDLSASLGPACDHIKESIIQSLRQQRLPPTKKNNSQKVH